MPICVDNRLTGLCRIHTTHDALCTMLIRNIVRPFNTTTSALSSHVVVEDDHLKAVTQRNQAIRVRDDKISSRNHLKTCAGRLGELHNSAGGSSEAQERLFLTSLFLRSSTYKLAEASSVSNIVIT